MADFEKQYKIQTNQIMVKLYHYLNIIASS